MIATAKTDECGNFCIWIPRWDIDWVLRFRHERFCFPIIFERPSVRDLLDELIPHKIPFPEPDPGPFGPRPGPGPDPSPLQRFDRGRLIKQIEDQLGRDVVLAVHRPGQTSQRDVDGDENAGQKGDVTCQQPEATVDVAHEGFGKAVDDAQIVHGKAPPAALCDSAVLVTKVRLQCA